MLLAGISAYPTLVEGSLRGLLFTCMQVPYIEDPNTMVAMFETPEVRLTQR